MKIVLYYAPITCALAPYITLTEAGAEFDVHPLNFRKAQHTSPEYLKINPKHKVPLLVVDGKSSARAWPSRPGLHDPFRMPGCCPPIRGRSCRPCR